LTTISESKSAPVMMGVSLALLDETVQETLEPGTPSPRARLELVRSIRAAGLPCQVLIAPVLPMLTDGNDDLERVITAVAEAGATSASVMALHLRPGAREWFLRWLGEQHPDLVDPYRELYRGGSYVLPSYASDLAARTRPLLRRHGLDHPSAWRQPRSA
jgi:DNA repair photolyase